MNHLPLVILCIVSLACLVGSIVHVIRRARRDARIRRAECERVSRVKREYAQRAALRDT